MAIVVEVPSVVEKVHRGSIYFSSWAPMEITESKNIIFIGRRNRMSVGRTSNENFPWSDVQDLKI